MQAYAGASHERLFQLIYQERWEDAASAMHACALEIRDDPLFERASDAFLSGVSSSIRSERIASRELLEKLFLLHSGGFVSLPFELYEMVVERLVLANVDRPDAALGYARRLPENPVCSEVLTRLGDPIATTVSNRRDPDVDVRMTVPQAQEGTRSLFRSAQEEAFFHAVRSVYPTFLIYPNVALAAMLDFDAIRARLSPDERRYFFRGMVDCVVFDHQAGYRPRYLFELDSPLHDDAMQQERDTRKERILAAAGLRLYRVRCRARDRSRERFERLIRETIA